MAGFSCRNFVRSIRPSCLERVGSVLPLQYTSRVPSPRHHAGIVLALDPQLRALDSAWCLHELATALRIRGPTKLCMALKGRSGEVPLKRKGGWGHGQDGRVLSNSA